MHKHRLYKKKIGPKHRGSVGPALEIQPKPAAVCSILERSEREAPITDRQIRLENVPEN